MRLLIVLTILALSACSSSYNEQDLLAKSVCCNSYTQLDYAEMDGDNEMEFALNNDKPAFKFEQGASYYHAIKLTGENRQFLLRSFFKRSEVKRFASPVLIELDENYEVLAHREPKLSLSLSARFEEPHMHGLVQLNEKTSYLIIYPSNDNTTTLTVEVSTGVSSGSATAGFGYFPGVNRSQELTKIPTGKMELIPASDIAREGFKKFVPMNENYASQEYLE